jgi:hypothetical protein
VELGTVIFAPSVPTLLQVPVVVVEEPGAVVVKGTSHSLVLPGFGSLPKKTFVHCPAPVRFFVIQLDPVP